MEIIFVYEYNFCQRVHEIHYMLSSTFYNVTLMNYDKNSPDLISLVGTHVVSILYTSFIDKKGVTDKTTDGSDNT